MKPLSAGAVAPRRAARPAAIFLAIVALCMSMIGVVAPNAFAAGAATISKKLDSVQSPAPVNGVFLVGQNVRYVITVQCSSLTTDCDTGAVTDVLDPNLKYVSVTGPSGADVPPYTASVSGQTVTIDIGPGWKGGSSLNFIVTAQVIGRPVSGDIPNTSSVTTGGVTTNSGTVVINVDPPQPTYGIDKQQVQANPVALGTNVTYAFSITGGKLDNVVLKAPWTVTETYPAGATVVNANGGAVDTANNTVTWTFTNDFNPATDWINCSTTNHCFHDGLIPSLTLSYSAPTFAEGTSVSDTAVLAGTAADGSSVTATDTVTTTFSAPIMTNTVSKGGTAEQIAGGVVIYEVVGKNSGNVAFTNYTLTDVLPTGITNWKVVRADYTYFQYPLVDGPIEVQALVGGVWTTLPQTGGSDWAVPATATEVRLKLPQLSASRQVAFRLTGEVPADAALGTTFENCASSGSDVSGFTAQTDCTTTTVTEPSVQLTPIKLTALSDPTKGSAVPGDQLVWFVGAKPTGTGQLTGMTVQDTIPAGFTVVRSACGMGASESYMLNYADCFLSNNTANAVQPTSIVKNADGTTTVTWADDSFPIKNPAVQNSTPYGYGTAWAQGLLVTVDPGTAINSYTNSVVVGTSEYPMECSATTGIPDDTSLVVGDTVCKTTAAVVISLSSAADIKKWDQGLLPNASISTGLPDATCPDWGGFTRYPCTAVTEPGQTFEYKFDLQNVGNTPLTNFVAYDILPHIGDTGVSQLLGGQSRLTEWTPTLTGPVQIVSEPAAAATQILYNLTYNPCRPELANADDPVDWQTTCDDTWYTAAQITDWSTVKSFKVLAYEAAPQPTVNATNVWLPAEQILLMAPMLAPMNAPASTSSPLDLSIAWNSIAHREYQYSQATGATTSLLAAEPRKVGIIVPPVPQVQVGDYVWVDTNSDGLQDSTDVPLPGVVLNLTGPDGQPVTDVFGNPVGPQTTDATGHYLFPNLPLLQAGESYTVTIDQLASATALSGYQPTTELVGTDRAVDSSTWSTSSGDLTTDGAKDLTLDFGFIEFVQPVSIGDYVWMDNNRDGLQTSGEPGVEGVTVTLKDAAGAVVGTTTTDVNGYYEFTDLVPAKAYTLTFTTTPAGAVWTTQDSTATGFTDANDSDVKPADGTISFTSPSPGTNGSGDFDATDNPTLDGGLVKLNLTLAKSVTSSGPYYVGSTPETSSLVTFTLTPHNDGPADALAGWSVTDVLPASLTFVSMTGEGYTCTGLTCVASSGLAAGADGPAITVTARVNDQFTGTAKNVAYVSPSDNEIVETNPLTVPTTDTDTSTTPTDNDAQAEITGSKLVSVGDYVWVDINRDGVQNDNSPLAGITVNLTDSSGNVRTTTTNDLGFYSFVDLIPGASYTIEFVKPADMHFTTQLNGDAALDSNADVVTGTWQFTAPESGNNSATSPDDPTIDAGLVKFNLTLTKSLDSQGPFYLGSTPETSSLVTFTLQPHNDGPADALSGWSVTEVMPAGLTLVSMSGSGYDCSVLPTCVASAPLLAGADGPAITVTARVSSPVGDWHNVAYVSPSPFDVPETNELVVPEPGTDTSTTPTDNDADVPLTTVSLVSLGDFVWFDSNRDGLQDAGEPVVADVTVNLYAADGTTLLATTTTSAAGYYEFRDLTPATDYVVEFIKPANTVFTTALAGDEALDSNADVTTGRATATTPATGANGTGPNATDLPTIDAGLIKLVSVGDYVWWDHNRDGQQTEGEPVVPGVTVNLLDSTGAVIATTTTDANGFYSFTDLLAGAAYTVEFVKPADTVFTGVNLGADVTDSDADPATGLVSIVAPADGANSATTPDDPTIDAGLVELVSMGDYVWFDTNRDGLQSAGEPAVVGVTVTLFDAAGAEVATTTTDASGFYSFNNLFGGTEYSVVFTKPANTVFTSQNTGADEALDSDADVATGKAIFTTPVSGGNSLTAPDLPTVDAGLVKLVSIGDYVWWDHNRDGQQTEGEPAVPDVTVTLLDAEGNEVGTTTTDANGFYSFTNLLAGADYMVVFTAPDGTFFTVDWVGDPASDSDADPVTGAVDIVAPADGANSATDPDDPTIDAGLVQYNLVLTKALVTTGTVSPGDNVTFTLTPRNEGPSGAWPGWKVTEVLPQGLTLVSMTGDGYECSGATCVATEGLNAGETGSVITVVAKVGEGIKGKLHNVAYVGPADDDGPETNPLDEPDTNTNTDTTPTDNDSQADVTVTPDEVLPQTGTDAQLALGGVALGLLALGGLMVGVSRRRRQNV